VNRSGKLANGSRASLLFSTRIYFICFFYYLKRGLFFLVFVRRLHHWLVDFFTYPFKYIRNL
jgi:hypothetical protein